MTARIIVSRTARLTSDEYQASKGNVRRFYWSYAYAYALRALRARGTQGTADRPDGGLASSGNATSDLVTLPTGRKLRPSQCSTDAEETASELAQDAAMRWWKNRKRRATRRKVAGGKGKNPSTVKHTPMTTKQAIRDTVREYRRSQRQRSTLARRCEKCRYVRVQCDECKYRSLNQKIGYARAVTPTGMNKSIHDSLDAVVSSANIDLIIHDYFPKMKSSKIRNHIEVLIRWLVSGSTQRDIAEHLGVTERYIHKLLTMLRESLNKDHFRDMTYAKERRCERIYGDRPGSGTSDLTGHWTHGLADIFDCIYGHTSSAMPTTVPQRDYLYRVAGSPDVVQWDSVNDYHDYPPSSSFVGPMLPVPTTQPDSTAYPPLPVQPESDLGPEFDAAYADLFYGEDASALRQ